MYEIKAVPVLIPVTIPVLLPIVAIPVLLLLQVPPVMSSANEVVLPTHIAGVPVIGSGKGSTVTVIVV